MEDGAVGVSTSLIYPPAVYASTDELIELVGMADKANQPIKQYSKGMMQRIGMAQALGESAPVERRAGERVHAGTMNGLGAISIQATGIGAESAVGRIAAAVHAAQGSRAPIQRLADRHRQLP